MTGTIVTIDGYAGTGKTSVARSLAERLGYHILNTGGMYRAAGFALVRAGFDIFTPTRDVPAITAVVSGWHFDMPPGRILLDGEDLTAELATEAAGRAASRVALFVEVRTKLKAEQKRLAVGRDIVCEGRDQGTVVFPEAACKFFLTASAEVRADRRVRQLQDLGVPVDSAAILQQIHDRDRQDESRDIDPLRKADDALTVDTSALTLDEVVDQLERTVRAVRTSASHQSGLGT